MSIEEKFPFGYYHTSHGLFAVVAVSRLLKGRVVLEGSVKRVNGNEYCAWEIGNGICLYGSEYDLADYICGLFDFEAIGKLGEK